MGSESVINRKKNFGLLSQSALGDSYTNSTSSADLSSITSVSSASASATASNSLSSSYGTVYLPSTTISGDLTVTGKVIATEAVEVASGGKLTLLDGEKYVFSSDLKVHGDLIVKKSEANYEGTAFDVSGESFEVSGNFRAEETGAETKTSYEAFVIQAVQTVTMVTP
ncbi:CPA_1a_G0000880.mRNA.1.CDS.1 [Saccharomyces cerevisiae]|nr:CPA_1a_G0000880.mRNA.1.CDS.1 [Saccharomyces cerevisiae]CAI7129493.1 CPA_1a_G0000880.mRNA.1.CDS.1 [Saccharomyces cerevisiae]